MHSSPASPPPRARAALPRVTAWLGPLLLLASLAATACGGERRDGAADTAAARVPAAAACGAGLVVDDFGDTTRIPGAPTRVVSLNPVTTELLFAIGQDARLVGRSSWDTYPREAAAVPALGGAIRPNVEAVLAAHPDLVVLYASNDNRGAAAQLRSAGVRVVSLKIDRVADFARAMDVLGAATCAAERARTVRDTVLGTFERVRAVTATLSHPSVVWPVGSAPLLVVGGDGFQHELLVAAGARNAFGDIPRPGPQVSQEEVLARDPDVLLVSPTRARRDSIAGSPRWRGMRAVREGRMLVYDTALVLRPSVQLGAGAASLARLLHPEAAARLPALPAMPAEPR